MSFPFLFFCLCIFGILAEDVSPLLKDSFIAYASADDYIVKLEIPVGSETNINRNDVVNYNRAMFRTVSGTKPRVVEIYHKETRRSLFSTFSDYDSVFQYIVNHEVEPESGIRFFLTEEAAYDYGRTITNGIYQSWYENGCLEEIGIMKNGQKNGEWKKYYDNGNRQSLSNWIDGKLDGLSKKWEPDGFLSSICDYRVHSLMICLSYDVDKHHMKVDEYGLKHLMFRRENEILEEDKKDHENQIMKSGDVSLTSDYKSMKQ